MFNHRVVDQTRRGDTATGPAPAPREREARIAATGLVVVGYLALIGATFAPDRLMGWLPFQGTATRPPAASVAPPPSTVGRAAALVATVPAVDQYLRGVEASDAALMWGALSAGQARTMRARGGSPEALQAELDAARARGVRYEGAELVAAYPLRSGEAYLFYSLVRRGVGGPDQRDRVSLVFNVDATGQVADVSWNRPEDLRQAAHGR
jgi:hypothetical protein